MAILRTVIRDTTRAHLDEGLAVAGQCLSAVGWVGNTVPDHPALTELPMSDVAQSGFVVGMALAGRWPIYIVRYQGFMLLNAALLLSYAAKSKALWGRDCPILIRAISMEGGIGPVASGCQHSMFTRWPDVRVAAPMTPLEWRREYDRWREHGGVVYLSEHRGAWGREEELLHLPLVPLQRHSAVLFPISITRFAADVAARKMFDEGYSIAVRRILVLAPFTPSEEALQDLRMAGKGLVLDDDYPGGAASDIAQQLHAATGAQMRVAGLEKRTAGFNTHDNLPPDAARIEQLVKEML